MNATSSRPWLLLLLMGGLLSFPERTLGMMEHHFIFFPESRLVATPATLDLAYRDVRFPADDGVRLHGWYLPGEREKPLILFFHGNAGNISHRIENLYLFQRELGVSVFIFDYRGYGLSEGRASEEGIYEDARGALNWLQERGWSTERIIYFGRSLGAAAALQLALEGPPAAVVLESPFPSVSAMGRHHYPLLFAALGWMLDARFDSLSKVESLGGVPLLLFQGERDAIVPVAMARRLFRRAEEPKTFHLISGAGHNDTYEKGGYAYWNAWRVFLSKLELSAPE